MKFSEFWLREWVNPATDCTKLVKKITMAGLEVNSMEPVSSFFTGVVVGCILESRPHSNADKLQVTKVNIGGRRPLNIVCGAANCRTNLRVAVATVGASFPKGFRIKNVALRGEISEGMLCSLSDLGMASNGDCIIELPLDAPIGQDIRDYLQLNDNTIDFSITPNRGDCLGLLGIAREIAACYRIPFVQPTIKTVSPVIKTTVPIRIDTVDSCPRYLGRVVKNIDISAPTTFWIKEKLRRSGLRSVGAIADTTNYVLLELGQPVHFFDYDRIEGGLIVRHARNNEALTLLDESNLNLFSDTLVISDHKKPLGLAGISNGSAAAVTPSTRNVVLECAFFQPSAITGRARRYGLHTETAYRYERGVDPALQSQAMNRATALLVSICGGQPGPVFDLTSTTAMMRVIRIILRRKMLDRLIGHFIKDRDVNNILIYLGCQVDRNKEGWEVLIPSWRFDLSIEADLIEEVARIYGYDAIPNIPVCTDLTIPSHHDKETLPLSRVKILLADRGYQEAITYSFVNQKNQMLLHPKQEPLLLLNPISQDMSAMRLSLWTGLLGAVVYNQRRQQQRIRFFETGLRFIPDEKADLGVRQELILAGVITGSRFDEHWDQAPQLVDFYDAKGDLEAILELIGKLDDVEFRAQLHPALCPRQCAEIFLRNESIGYIGAIHSKIQEMLSLHSRTLVFELLWEKLAEKKVPKAKKISRFPSNRRDIAVVVANHISAADIIAEFKKVAGNQLTSINLFDIYKGPGIAVGFKSLALSLTLQDATRTLKEEEINQTVARCIAALQRRFQASLRN